MDRRIFGVLAGLLIVVSPALSSAQTLADRVPADAILYVGWRGAADLGPGYEGSHLQAFLDQSKLPTVLHQSFPALLQRVESAYPQASVVIDSVMAIGGPLFNHPSALYLGPTDVSMPGAPKVRVALLCDAGADAANMATKLNQLISQIPPGPVQVTVNQFGTLVVVSTYEFAEHPDNPLSADAEFVAAMKQVSQDPVDVLYFSGTQLTQQIDSLVTEAQNPQATQMWPKVREALGMPGLKALILTDAFDGKDWLSQVFIDAPAPRVGLAAMLEGHPLSQDTLKMIPDTATMAWAGEFDLAKFVDQIRSITTQIDPQVGQMLDGYISQVNGALGFNIQTDLLGAFGDEWAAYEDPEIAGYGSAGMVIINQCRDAKKLDASLSSLEKLATSTISLFTSQFMPLLTIQFRTETIDGMEVHFADLPVVTPSWTIKDGFWYFGMYPQVVVGAAERGDEKSILDNAAFQDEMTRLAAPSHVTGLSFENVPAMADQGYQSLLTFTSLFVGAGDLVGMNAPAMVIPPLSKIKPELEPDGAVSWVDDAGWHAKAICAFPGDQILGMDQGGSQMLVQIISSLASLGMEERQQERIERPAPPMVSPGL